MDKQFGAPGVQGAAQRGDLGNRAATQVGDQLGGAGAALFGAEEL
jgi:hypothetical protein